MDREHNSRRSSDKSFSSFSQPSSPTSIPLSADAAATPSNPESMITSYHDTSTAGQLEVQRRMVNKIKDMKRQALMEKIVEEVLKLSGERAVLKETLRDTRAVLRHVLRRTLGEGEESRGTSLVEAKERTERLEKVEREIGEVKVELREHEEAVLRAVEQLHALFKSSEKRRERRERRERRSDASSVGERMDDRDPEEIWSNQAEHKHSDEHHETGPEIPRPESPVCTCAEAHFGPRAGSPNGEHTKHAEQTGRRAFLLQTKAYALEAHKSATATLCMLLLHDRNAWLEEASALRELVNNAQAKQIAISGRNTKEEIQAREEEIEQYLGILEGMDKMISGWDVELNALGEEENNGDQAHLHLATVTEYNELQDRYEALEEDYRLFDLKFSALERKLAQTADALRITEQGNCALRHRLADRENLQRKVDSELKRGLVDRMSHIVALGDSPRASQENPVRLRGGMGSPSPEAEFSSQHSDDKTSATSCPTAQQSSDSTYANNPNLLPPSLDSDAREWVLGVTSLIPGARLWLQDTCDISHEGTRKTILDFVEALENIGMRGWSEYYNNPALEQSRALSWLLDEHRNALNEDSNLTGDDCNVWRDEAYALRKLLSEEKVAGIRVLVSNTKEQQYERLQERVSKWRIMNEIQERIRLHFKEVGAFWKKKDTEKVCTCTEECVAEGGCHTASPDSDHDSDSSRGVRSGAPSPGSPKKPNGVSAGVLRQLETEMAILQLQDRLTELENNSESKDEHSPKNLINSKASGSSQLDRNFRFPARDNSSCGCGNTDYISDSSSSGLQLRGGGGRDEDEEYVYGDGKYVNWDQKDEEMQEETAAPQQTIGEHKAIQAEEEDKAIKELRKMMEELEKQVKNLSEMTRAELDAFRETRMSNHCGTLEGAEEVQVRLGREQTQRHYFWASFPRADPKSYAHTRALKLYIQQSPLMFVGDPDCHVIRFPDGVNWEQVAKVQGGRYDIVKHVDKKRTPVSADAEQGLKKLLSRTFLSGHPRKTEIDLNEIEAQCVSTETLFILSVRGVRFLYEVDKEPKDDDIDAQSHSMDTVVSHQHSDHPCDESLTDGVPQLRGGMRSLEEDEDGEGQSRNKVPDLSEQEALQLCNALFDTETAPVQECFQMYADIFNTWYLTTDSFGRGYEMYQGKKLGPSKLGPRSTDDKGIYRMKTEIAKIKSEIGRRLHDLRYTLDLDGITPPIMIDLPPQFTIHTEDSRNGTRLVLGKWSTVFHFPDGATPEQTLGLRLPRKDLGQSPHHVHIIHFGAPFMEKSLKDAIAAGLREINGPSWEELTGGLWQDVGQGDTYVVGNKDTILDWGDNRHHGNGDDEYIPERSRVGMALACPDYHENSMGKDKVSREDTSEGATMLETCDVCAQDRHANEQGASDENERAQEAQDTTTEDNQISAIPATIDSDEQSECDDDPRCRRNDCKCPIRIAIRQHVVTSSYDDGYFPGISFSEDEFVEVIHFPGGATQDQVLDFKVPRVNFRPILKDAVVTHIGSLEEEQQLKDALEPILQKWDHSFDRFTRGRWSHLGKGDTYIAGKKHIMFPPRTNDTGEKPVGMRGGSGDEEHELDGDYEHDAKRMQRIEKEKTTVVQYTSVHEPIQRRPSAFQGHAEDYDRIYDHLMEETARACPQSPPSECVEAWMAFGTALQTRNHSLEHELEDLKHMHHDLIHDMHWQIGTTVELEERAEAAEEERDAVKEELEDLKSRWSRLVGFVETEADHLHRIVQKEMTLLGDYDRLPRLGTMRGGHEGPTPTASPESEEADKGPASTPSQGCEEADDVKHGPDHPCAATRRTSFDFFPKRATIVFAGDPPHIYQFPRGSTLGDIRTILKVGSENETFKDAPYCLRILDIMKTREAMGVQLLESFQDERVTIGIPYVPPGVQIDNDITIAAWRTEDADMKGLETLIQGLEVNTGAEKDIKATSQSASASSEETDYYQDLGDLVNTLNNVVDHDNDTGSPKLCIGRVGTAAGKETYFDLQDLQQTPVVSVRGGGRNHGNYDHRRTWDVDSHGNRVFPLLSPRLPRETNAPPNTPDRYGTFTPSTVPGAFLLPPDHEIATSNEPLGLRLSRLMFPPNFVQKREHTIRRFSWRHTKQKNPQFKDKSSRRFKYTKGPECEDWETQLDNHREHCDFCQSVFLEEEHGTQVFEPAEDIRHEDDAPMPGVAPGRPWERSAWPDTTNTSPFPVIEDPDPRFSGGAGYQDSQLRGGAGHERDLEDDDEDWRSEWSDIASLAQSSSYQNRAFRNSSTLSTKTLVEPPSPVERNFSNLRRRLEPADLHGDGVYVKDISGQFGESAPSPYYRRRLSPVILTPSKTTSPWLLEIWKARVDGVTGDMRRESELGRRRTQDGLARSIEDRYAELRAENWLKSPRPAPAPPVRRQLSKEDEGKNYVHDIKTWESKYLIHHNSLPIAQSSIRQQSFRTDQYVCLSSARHTGLGRSRLSTRSLTLPGELGTRESMAKSTHEQIRRLSPLEGRRLAAPKPLANLCQRCLGLLAALIRYIRDLKERIQARRLRKETPSTPAPTRSHTYTGNESLVQVSRLDTLKQRVRVKKTKTSSKETPPCPATTPANPIFNDCYHQQPVRVTRRDKSPRKTPPWPASTRSNTNPTAYAAYLSHSLPAQKSQLNKALPPTPEASTSTLNLPLQDVSPAPIPTSPPSPLPSNINSPHPKSAARPLPSPPPQQQITLFERACAMAQGMDDAQAEVVRNGTEEGRLLTVAGPSDLVGRAVWMLEYEERKERERIEFTW
jgi:hypothetical protein